MTAETILNRKALRDFHILERYEAGLELKGSEVKSIRAGKANISDAFARIEKGEAFLYNDAIVGIRGDTERLREVEAALLGER